VAETTKVAMLSVRTEKGVVMINTLGRDALKFVVRFTCPKTGGWVEQEIDRFDFSSFDDDCECCGSHGEMKVDFKCESCDGSHEYFIQEW